MGWVKRDRRQANLIGFWERESIRQIGPPVKQPPDWRWIVKRAVFFFVFLFTIAALAGIILYASPASEHKAMPDRMGYCVRVEGIDFSVNVPYHHPDPAKPEEFKASVRNAVKLIGLQTGRFDPALADRLRFPQLGDLVSADSTADCTCTTTYRDRNGNVLGCKGSCGDCQSCGVPGRRAILGQP